MASRYLTSYFPARTLILAVGEIGILLTSFLLAMRLEHGEHAEFVESLDKGILRLVIFVVLGLLWMYFLDLYNSNGARAAHNINLDLLKMVGVLSLSLGFLGIVFPRLMVGDYVFFTSLPILATLVLLWRKAFLTVNRSRLFVQRTLIIGEQDYGTSLWHTIEKRPNLGLELIGYVSHFEDPSEEISIPRLGTIEDLERIVQSEGIRRIVVTMRDRRGKLPVNMLLSLKARGVQIEDLADFYESVTGQVHLESLRTSWLLFSRGFFPSRLLQILSRIGTTLLAALLLALAIPLMALIAVAIWLDTGNPILFRQRRVGQHGKLFNLYEF